MFEDVAKSVEKFDKEIGQIAKHFGISDKDQSMIKAQVDQIGKLFGDNKGQPEKLLAALNDHVTSLGANPKKLASHTMAMKEYMAAKTEEHKFHGQKVNEDLTIPRPTVG